MNPVVLFLASGEALYPATAVLLLLMLLPRVTNRWLLRLRNLAAWCALAMLIMACPPVGLLLSILTLTAFFAWFIIINCAKPSARLPASIALAACLLLVCILEFPHRALPTLPLVQATHLTVLGDSLSAGIDPNTPNWPQRLTTTYQLPTKNLAQPGAQVADLPDMLKKVTPDDTLVLLEIGGNDLIANTPSADFERHLDAALARLAAPNRTLLMMELPLLPHKIAYGTLQRRLADRYHVHLLPKRLLIDILASADATSDGLHLSPAGSQKMATLLASTLHLPAIP